MCLALVGAAGLVVLAGAVHSMVAADTQVPSWIKTVAVLWGSDQITDGEFLAAIEYLVRNDIIRISDTVDSDRSDDDSGLVHGIITKNIDGNTIVIDDTRIRLSLVDVEDSGNKSMPHAEYARQICPVGGGARYNIDDMQPTDVYGRTLAVVYCEGQKKSLNELLIISELGWVNDYWCDKSEFQYEDWARKGCGN